MLITFMLALVVVVAWLTSEMIHLREQVAYLKARLARLEVEHQSTGEEDQ